MNEEELNEFIHHYDPNKDYWRINFEWNGKHSDEFYDANCQFRFEVSERVRKLGCDVSVELLKDLFIEHAKCSKEAWGSYQYLHLIGAALINKGRSKYVLLYLRFSRKSFDALLGSGIGEPWEDYLLLEIRDFLEEEKNKSHDEKTLSDIEFGLNRRFGLHNLSDPHAKQKRRKRT